jgi:hypothetical protein
MKTNCSSIRKASRKTNVLHFWRSRTCRCRSAVKPVTPAQATGRAANDLQERFMKIGLPDELMMELQVTEHELFWDAQTQARRERFLEQGHVLVMDRRGAHAETYFLAPEPSSKALSLAVA